MCGIAGIFDLKGKRPMDGQALARMSAALIHRGPDGEGTYTEDSIGLVHRRLAIIDIDGGAQPFQTMDQSGILTYNGEIYNFPDLKKDLVANGVHFRSESDTEVLAEGLRRDGTEFLQQLAGMFAFAYWDRQSQSLLLARDRMGEKPLYYGQSPEGYFVFASEMNALLASGYFSRDLDNEAVADYLAFGYVPDPKSIYRGIRKLPAGSFLRLSRHTEARIESYWQPSLFSPDAKSPSPDDLLDRLDAVVTSQMISDVPLGGFLSGGVDSSAVVSSMAQSPGNVTAFTIGFDHAAFDERPYAERLAKQYSVNHICRELTINSAELIDKIAGIYGEPFGDSSALPTYLVCAMARQHATVALSGDGGDEVFAGYRRYPFFASEEHARRAFPQSLRAAFFGTAGKLYPKLDWAPRPFRLKTTLQSLGDDMAFAYFRTVSAILPDRLTKMLSADFHASLGGYHPRTVIDQLVDKAPRNADPVLLAQYIDQHTWLPGRMLAKVDRASMASSLEVRTPFLDHRLVDWANRLPRRDKHRSGEGKWILKKALEARVPHDILYRQKQGFGLPIKEWLKVNDGPLTRLQTSTAWRESGIFNQATIDQYCIDHHSGRLDYSQELWSVVMFDAFMTNASAQI
ncbi:MAG: asparagine synthase (glutamine-hydrolyzing) [Pseudomonadota bacterium]